MFKSETHFNKACTSVFASFQFRQFAFNCKSILRIRCIIDLECCQSPISTMCLAFACCELVCNTHIVHWLRLFSIALHFSVFCTSYAQSIIGVTHVPAFALHCTWHCSNTVRCIGGEHVPHPKRRECPLLNLLNLLNPAFIALPYWHHISAIAT